MTTTTSRAVLSVGLGPAPAAARTVAALTSLPESYRVSTPTDAVDPDGKATDLLVVSGSVGWPQRLARAVESGPRAVVLERPEPAQPQEVEPVAALAAQRGVVVAVDTDYAANSLCHTVLPLIVEDLAEFGVIDAVATVATGAEVDSALLALLGVLRPLLSGRGLVAVPGGSPTCRAAVGSDAGSVTLAAVTGAGRPALELALVGAQRRWRVSLPSDGTARPAEAASHDGAGTRTVRPVYESAARATWRELADELNGGTGRSHRLTDLVADLRLYATVSS